MLGSYLTEYIEFQAVGLLPVFDQYYIIIDLSFYLVFPSLTYING